MTSFLRKALLNTDLEGYPKLIISSHAVISSVQELISTSSKSQSNKNKHMIRFNQFMNGERVLKIEPHNIGLLSEWECTVTKFYRILYKNEIVILKQSIENSATHFLKFKAKFHNINQESIFNDLNKRLKIKYCFKKGEEENMSISVNVLQVLSELLQPYHSSADRSLFMYFLKVTSMFVTTFKCESYSPETKELFIIPVTPKDHSGLKDELNELSDDFKYTPNEYGEVQYKPTGNEQKFSINASLNRNYEEFFDEFCPNKTPKEKRRHHYSVSVHPAICTDESYNLYRLFNKAVFDKDSTRGDFESFLCNSSLYDPQDPEPHKSYSNQLRLDGDREFKDIGPVPEFNGGYHMYHRIDGKLFAITAFELIPSYLLSCYCFYDPSYRLLSPGAFTCIREIEYMRKLRSAGRPALRYYGMEDLIPGNPKMEYKQHMRPTEIFCPIASQWVLLTDEIVQKVIGKAYTTLVHGAEAAQKMSEEIAKYHVFIVKIRYKRRKDMNVF